MAPTATRTAPDINAKLAEARAEAEQLRGELARAETDLAAAREREDYQAAERAKQQADALRPHLALADASVQALVGALAALDEQRRAEQVEAQRQAREEAAQRVINEAMAAEREAQEQAQRHFAEALAGLDAVRGSLQAAKAAEQAGAVARRAAAQARAELTGSAPGPAVSPNWVGSRIDRSRLLFAILHGRDL